MSDEKQAPPAQKPDGTKPRVWEIDRGRETLEQKKMIDFHNSQNARRRTGTHVPIDRIIDYPPSKRDHTPSDRTINFPLKKGEHVPSDGMTNFPQPKK